MFVYDSGRSRTLLTVQGPPARPAWKSNPCARISDNATLMTHSARPVQGLPTRMARKSVFQSLNELADSEDTLQHGGRAASPGDRDWNRDRGAMHKCGGLFKHEQLHFTAFLKVPHPSLAVQTEYLSI